MKNEVESTLFNEPSGNICGFITATATVKGKRRRVAHALLMADGELDITLDVPNRVSAKDVVVISNTLKEFAARMKTLKPIQKKIA